MLHCLSVVRDRSKVAFDTPPPGTVRGLTGLSSNGAPITGRIPIADCGMTDGKKARSSVSFCSPCWVLSDALWSCDRSVLYAGLRSGHFFELFRSRIEVLALEGRLEAWSSKLWLYGEFTVEIN